MITLRPYQEQIIEEVRQSMSQGCRSLLVTSPTGSGKTALTAEMVRRSLAKSPDNVVWFIVHRRELIKQSAAAFTLAKVRHGICAAEFMPEASLPVQICSIGTLKNRHRNMRRPKLIIWDECHHVGAKSWGQIFKDHPQAFHVGLTATPERLDGKGLGAWFNKLIRGPNVQDLIAAGYLAPYRLYAPPSVSMAGVHTRMGDFVKSEIGELFDKPTITGSAIAHYRQHAMGKRAVVFAVSVQHSKHIVDEFNAAGIRAEHVDGETDSRERDMAIELFRQGRIKVLSNVELFGEGFDLPAMECVILLRPTQSLGLHLQQVGRVLRTAPGKTEAIILDHAGNTERHGLPCETREWTLEDRIINRKGESESGPSVKVCASCFRAQWLGKPSCMFCGHVFELKPRSVKEVEGELIEIDPAKARAARTEARREQGRALTEAELIEIGKQRGFKRPALWARHVIRARRRRGGE